MTQVSAKTLLTEVFSVTSSVYGSWAESTEARRTLSRSGTMNPPR